MNRQRYYVNVWRLSMSSCKIIILTCYIIMSTYKINMFTCDLHICVILLHVNDVVSCISNISLSSFHKGEIERASETIIYYVKQ